MNNVIENGLLELQQEMVKTIKQHKGKLREALRREMDDCLLSLCDAINSLMLDSEHISKPIESSIRLLMAVNLADFQDRADELIMRSKLHEDNVAHLDKCWLMGEAQS